MSKLILLHCRYMDYDNQPTFNNFKTFGGWKEPVMKQYTQDSKDCVDNLNLDYTMAAALDL